MPMNSQAAIAKAFMPELANIYARHGEAATLAVIAGMDKTLAEQAKALGGGSYSLPFDWPDWQAIEAQLAGQAVAEDRATKAQGDLIQLTPDGLARIVAAARAEPGKVTEIEYDHYGADGKPVRITQRPTR